MCILRTFMYMLRTFNHVPRVSLRAATCSHPRTGTAGLLSRDQGECRSRGPGNQSPSPVDGDAALAKTASTATEICKPSITLSRLRTPGLNPRPPFASVYAVIRRRYRVYTPYSTIIHPGTYTRSVYSVKRRPLVRQGETSPRCRCMLRRSVSSQSSWLLLRRPETPMRDPNANASLPPLGSYENRPEVVGNARRAPQPKVGPALSLHLGRDDGRRRHLLLGHVADRQAPSHADGARTASRGGGPQQRRCLRP